MYLGEWDVKHSLNRFIERHGVDLSHNAIIAYQMLVVFGMFRFEVIFPSFILIQKGGEYETRGGYPFRLWVFRRR